MEAFVPLNRSLLLILIIAQVTSSSPSSLAQASSLSGNNNQQQQQQASLEPTITPFFFDQNVQENQRSSVLCTISSGELPVSISWLKDGQLLTPQVAQLKKITIKPDSDQSTLKFSSVRLEHAGNYTCVAKNKAGIQTYSAQLVVHGGPRWLKEPPSEPVLSTKGQTIVLDCLTIGWPRPQQVWQVKSHLQSDFESISPNHSAGRLSIAANGSLILKNVDKQDEANYLCKSHNGIGPGISQSTSLKVVVPAQFAQTKQQPSVIRKQNQVQLRCDAFGDEPISIEWYKNKQRLANDLDPRFSIHNKPLQNGLISIMVIKSAQRQDNSVYECITRNSVGKDRLPIELVVQEEPDSIENMKVVQWNSRSVNIEWPEPYDGKSSITNYVFQYKRLPQLEPLSGDQADAALVMNASPALYQEQHHSTSDISSFSSRPFGADDEWHQSSRLVVPVLANSTGTGETRSITIEKLEPSTRYMIRALAMNAIGQSKFSQPVEFQTQEEAPQLGPSNIKAVALNSTSIQVSWDEIPRGKQFGRIHGYYVGYRLGSNGSGNNYVYKPYLINNDHAQQQPSRLEFVINELKRDTVYEITVIAFNGRGSGPSSDSVICKTIEMEPPKPVKLHIRRESNDSIFIEWTRDPSDQNPVDDYVLYQEKNSMSQEWTQVRLPGNQTQYKAPGLKCGTRYQFYIVAHNKVGKSLHSEVVGASTSGSLPAVPSKMSLLKIVNSTCLLVNLNSFQDNGCRIRTFNIRYRAEKSAGQAQLQPHPLISAANGLTVQQQALTALSKGASVSNTPPTANAQASTSSALAGSQAPSEWVTVRPKINQRHGRVAEEDRMEYICDLSPTGEYTLHVAAQNDVGRAEADYTVLMSSDELRHSWLREALELLAGLPNVFAYIPSLLVFLLAGLLVSLASLILYTTIIKYYQKFIIIQNQIRATRRAKQDEKRRRKLMNSSASRQSQKLDLWADEFDEDPDDGVEADGDDEAGDEDENSSSSGSSGSGAMSDRMRQVGCRQQQRQGMSAAHLQFVNQQQQRQRNQRLGHYMSNIANSAFDSSSLDSPCNNSLMDKQCGYNNSSCLSTASTDSIQGRFQCLNSKQYVKMNEYTMLPSISASLSPPRAADIYGTVGGARPSPQHQQQQLPVAGPMAPQTNNNNSIYYSTLRRSTMQTYLPNQQRRMSAANTTGRGPGQNIADIYGYYVAPPQPQPLNSSPTSGPQQLNRGPIQAPMEEVANSIFVPPQQIIYSAPNIRHPPMFL